MPAIPTLRSIPDEMYERLKASAQTNRRSLNSEALASLETVLLPGKMPPAERLARIQTLRAPLSQGQFHAEDTDAFKREGRP